MSQEGGEEAAGSSGRLLFVLIPLQVLKCTFRFSCQSFPVPVQLIISGTPLGTLAPNSEGFSFCF